MFHFQQYQSHGSAGVLHRIMTARRGFNILHTDRSRGRRRGRRSRSSPAVLLRRSSGRSSRRSGNNGSSSGSGNNTSSGGGASGGGTSSGSRYETVLSVRNLTKQYTSGGMTVEVLSDVGPAELREGSVTCLLGSNGAGKVTTTITTTTIATTTTKRSWTNT